MIEKYVYLNAAAPTACDSCLEPARVQLAAVDETGYARSKMNLCHRCHAALKSV